MFALIPLLCAVPTLDSPKYPLKGDVKVEKVTYLNLPNCYKLSNGTVEVIVTTDMGPRVIRYGFVGEENVFAELPDTVVKTDLGEWKPLGGHRLWSAPEAWPRSYAPDTGPLEYKQNGANSVTLTLPAEAKVGIQKEMTISLDSEGTGVTVHHRIVNRNLFDVELATWGLTIMSGGGVTIIPQEPYISHDDVNNGLLPARALIMWPYTDLTDPRYTIGKSYIQLKTDEKIAAAQKIGLMNKQGWAAYARNKTMFIKRFGWINGMPYPDYGANNETYTAGTFMELETAGPLRRLHWGESTDHTERWRLFKNIDIGATEATLDAAMAPLLALFPK
ncbi:MAG: hypothetical protein ABJA67_06280 [Chthonomonadales bacterium]